MAVPLYTGTLHGQASTHVFLQVTDISVQGCQPSSSSVIGQPMSSV